MVKWSSVVWLVLLIAASPAAASAQGHTPELGYQDDRSSAESVIGSNYNAVNRREYTRAYSYWEPEAAARELQPFDQFAMGYADTASVDVTLGDVGTGVGVPVTLAATLADGSPQTFVGCYTLHLGRPQLQAVPPFRPLAIQGADIQQVDNDADTAALMARACPTV
jgi:hypothetical protein